MGRGDCRTCDRLISRYCSLASSLALSSYASSTALASGTVPLAFSTSSRSSGTMSRVRQPRVRLDRRMSEYLGGGGRRLEYWGGSPEFQEGGCTWLALLGETWVWAVGACAAVAHMWSPTYSSPAPLCIPSSECRCCQLPPWKTRDRCSSRGASCGPSKSTLVREPSGRTCGGGGGRV